MEVGEIHLFVCKAEYFQSWAGYCVSLETPASFISVPGAVAGAESECSSPSATWTGQ